MSLEEIKNSITQKPFFETENGLLYNADCLDIMKQMPDECVDLVVTDPPYNFTTASAGAGKLNPWADLLNSAYWFSLWMGDVMRLLQVSGALWDFCNWRSIVTITKAVFDIGHQIESLLVWDKEWIGPGGHRGLRPRYEFVALICRPDFQIPDRGISDIKSFLWSSIKPSGHPAEKPEKLIHWLIDISDKDFILDPFLGSGTTCVVAQRLHRKWIGIEINEEYCKIAQKRIEGEIEKQRQQELSL